MKGLLILAYVALCIVAGASRTGAITCGDVASNLGQCVPFLRGQAAGPTVGCCDGVRKLTGMVPTAADRRVACNCLKQAVGQIRDIRANAASSLPGICRAPVPFPVSLNVDCNRIQ